MSNPKKLAVWKFASCDGCQLSILDLEDDILLLADKVEVANFPEASSRVLPGPYDVSLVEGSITTPHDRERIQEVRRQSKFLITIGACATAGGIQSLRNFQDVKGFISAVYAHPEYIQTLEHSSAIADHVTVDFELRGCPVNKQQLLEVLTSFLAQKKPNIPNESVCMECKRQHNICVLVASDEPCLGPVTHAGCGALCPSFARGCYGCYGPKENANPVALSGQLLESGMDRAALVRLYRSFNAAAPEFEKESRRHDQEND